MKLKLSFCASKHLGKGKKYIGLGGNWIFKNVLLSTSPPGEVALCLSGSVKRHDVISEPTVHRWKQGCHEVWVQTLTWYILSSANAASIPEIRTALKLCENVWSRVIFLDSDAVRLVYILNLFNKPRCLLSLRDSVSSGFNENSSLGLPTTLGVQIIFSFQNGHKIFVPLNWNVEGFVRTRVPERVELARQHLTTGSFIVETYFKNMYCEAGVCKVVDILPPKEDKLPPKC